MSERRQLLAELKQFSAYYSFVMDHVITTKRDMEDMAEEEVAGIEEVKDRTNTIYQSLLIGQTQDLAPLIELLRIEVIQNDTMPTNLVLLSLKFLIKVFEYGDLQEVVEGYDPTNLLVGVIDLKFDDVSVKID
jgi:hypothetical protein